MTKSKLTEEQIAEMHRKLRLMLAKVIEGIVTGKLIPEKP